MTANNRLVNMLINQEGKRKFPYECTAGKISIGVGRNLDDRGLSDDEIMYLLHNDIEISESELSRTFEWFGLLNQARQDALISLHFNIGLSNLLKFKNTLKHLSDGDFQAASEEMLESRWADQVGQRAIDLSDMIRTGKYITS
jgi:lysozyme